MKFILLYCAFFVFVSCNTNQTKLINEKEGELHAVMKLDEIGAKSFILDNDTAPKPYYIQITKDSLKDRQFTFLNSYNNSIYYYDYSTTKFIKKITFDKEGPNGIKRPLGYHIKNKDSIYIYSQFLEVLLTNGNGNILKKISLIGGHDIQKSALLWAYTFPEYGVETVKPFMETSKELLLTGQFMGNMNDSLIHKFKFTAHIDFNLNKIKYTSTYPTQLYGDNVYWGEDFFLEVFPQLHPDGNKLIYSFPISHDLFITDINSNNYKRVYAGSNFADAICSIDEKSGRDSREAVKSSFVRQDMYAAIIYDKFRKVYYRFVRKAIPDAPVNTSWKEKKIAVILMDDKFNYLGETVLGTEREWHWQNSFVTKEGLNIECIDGNTVDEQYLTLKIFIPKKII